MPSRNRVLLLLSAALLGIVPEGLGGDPQQVKQDEAALQQARVPTDGPGLIAFFRKRTLNKADLERLQALVRQLGDDSFVARENASAQLVAAGPPVLPLLRQAVKDADAEVVYRARECLRQIEPACSPAVVAAAVRLLAARRPPGTVEALLGYLPLAEDEMVVEEARAALTTVALRGGKPDPALAAALDDPHPLRRAMAAAALGRAAGTDQRAALRKLLKDPEPLVRLHAGLVLAEQKERDAVPVLINLLAELDTHQAIPVEDMLYRLAGEKAPAVAAGSDGAARRAYRDAWHSWWREQGDKIDLAVLTEPPKLLGYTMVVQLDQGRLLELDAAKKVRWQIEGLEFPLDVQLLPGDRVLVAEQQAGRITERNFKGEILWQQAVVEPLMAQRLPNGNTFIATRTQLVEVNRDGKVVFSHIRPGGEGIMRAQKLRNGDIACITMSLVRNETVRFIRLNAAGKELSNFPVAVRTSGGRVEVLPNGRVLVPEMDKGRVAEYDAQGKVVWEVRVEQPIAAVRLPNGNTLVTSMSQNRAIELDRNGKEVWEYKQDTRVTRAWRR